MDWRVVLFDLNIDETDIAAVTNVLASRWLAMGRETQALEQEFAAALGVPAAVALSSGTAALHLAALGLGLGPGDEVIVPALSFVASAATIALTGARPVFAEIHGPHDLTLSPEDVARRITARTKAIVVMHYGGYPVDMAAILDLARRHNLAVIEDAAHAPVVATPLGSLGTLGDIGCFSFFATKNVAMGEGGMLVARDPALLARIRSLRSHCMTSSSWDKHQGRPSGYDVHGLGLNYRPTEMQAALGRVQLGKLPADRERRRALVRRYVTSLRGLAGLELPFMDYAGDTAHHLFPILLPAGWDRDAFQRLLKEEGIQSSVHYPPTHLFSYYQAQYGYRPGDLPITEDVAAREVTLPLHTLMDGDDVELVAHTIHRFWEQGGGGAQ